MKSGNSAAYTVFTVAVFCVALILFGKLTEDQASMVPPAEYVYWEESSASGSSEENPEGDAFEDGLESRPGLGTASKIYRSGDGSPYGNGQAPIGDGSDDGEGSAASRDSAHKESSQKTSGLKADPNRVVNINTAGVEDLCSLDGIGEVLALRIIDYRESNGGFSSIDEITNVKGIAEKKYAAIKNRITV